MPGRVEVRLALATLGLAAWACGAPSAPTAEPTQFEAAPSAEAPFPTTAVPGPTEEPAAVLPGPWAGDDSITIRGNDDFVQQTEAALDLLETSAPDAYAKILMYVEVIEQGEHSGMWAFEVPPRYEVGDATAFASLPWYASTIAHDATHSELYHTYRLAHPGEEVPQDAWADMESERFCNAYQLDVLKRIGGHEVEIEYLAGLTGDHCDLDDDGDCDWDDYNARDW